jgi:hypothetical protein
VPPFLFHEEVEIQNASAQFIADICFLLRKLKMPAASTELLANELAFFYEFLNLIRAKDIPGGLSFLASMHLSTCVSFAKASLATSSNTLHTTRNLRRFPIRYIDSSDQVLLPLDVL